jgi:hypothetical protein
LRRARASGMTSAGFFMPGCGAGRVVSAFIFVFGWLMKPRRYSQLHPDDGSERPIQTFRRKIFLPD